jgi:HEPN domain-containing protein
VSGEMDADQREWLDKWLARAEGDMTVARVAREAGGDRPVPEAVCFHSQQAVEKLLKAFLIRHSVRFAKVHDLEYLRALCATIDPEFSSLGLGDLSGYAVSARYPGVVDEVTVAQADEALRIAERARDFILRRLRA